MPSLSALDQQFNKYDSNSHILTVTVTLKTLTSLFLSDAQAYDDASSFQVCLQKVQPFRRYYPNEHSLKCSSFAVTLTLNTAIQSFRKTFRLMMVHHQFTFSSKRISSSEDTVETVIY